MAGSSSASITRIATSRESSDIATPAAAPVAGAAQWLRIRALYDIGRWIVLFSGHPVHEDFRIFYVAARPASLRVVRRIYDIETLRRLLVSFTRSNLRRLVGFPSSALRSCVADRSAHSVSPAFA